jgi:bis(5'-nucleosyl)-tetraphosphatase (symmetrical)
MGNFRTKEWVLVHAAVGPDWSIAEIKARAGAVSSRLGSSKVEEARTFLGSDTTEDPVRDDLGVFTSCRSLVAETGGWRWMRRESDPLGVPWHEAWRAGSHDYGVIYGHWATQGLHATVNLRGLDTGCVYHGRWGAGKLTAWLPNMSLKDPFSVPDQCFWHALARRVYDREDK